MMTEKTLKLAARWIYKNRHTGYWTNLLLVREFASHPDVRLLQLSPDDADSIFSALERKEFLRKLEGEFVEIGGGRFQKYKIEMAHLPEFRKFADLPFYYRWLPDSILQRLDTLNMWLIVCAALVATSFFGALFSSLGEKLSVKLFGE